MINPWFKFYGGEYLSDPKIGSLTPQERSCWITLLCLSSTSSVPGMVEYLTIEVLLEKSGIRFNPYQPEEWDNCLSILSKFERMKMIKKTDEGHIEVLNWNKRQEHTMTATERSRKFRLKQKESEEIETDATKRNENATLEENRIEENRIDNTMFDEFWKLYPKRRKSGKTIPKEKWDKLTDEQKKLVMEDIRKRPLEHWDWIKQGGDFVPAPEVYLNSKKEYWLQPIVKQQENKQLAPVQKVDRFVKK